MTTKQDKLRERELKLVASASELITEQGVFDLRMSDVAKHAGVSIGTLYVHFESKEDLIMGCALNTLRYRSQTFQAIVDLTTWNAPTKVAGFLMADYFFNKRLGELKEIEKLSMIPSIWKRSSQAKVTELMRVCEGICSVIEAVLDKAIESGEFVSALPQHERTAGTINTVLCGTTMGLHSVFSSFCMSEADIINPQNELSTYLEALNSLYKGFQCDVQFTEESFNDLLFTIQEIVDSNELFTNSSTT